MRLPDLDQQIFHYLGHNFIELAGITRFASPKDCSARVDELGGRLNLRPGLRNYDFKRCISLVSVGGYSNYAARSQALGKTATYAH